MADKETSIMGIPPTNQTKTLSEESPIISEPKSVFVASFSMINEIGENEKAARIAEAKSTEMIAKINADANEKVGLAHAEALKAPAKHLTIRHVITALAIGTGLWVMCKIPALAWPIVALIAILGGKSIFDEYFQNKKTN